MAVQIPGKAVSTGDNIESPTVDLLRALNLLGTDTEITASGKFVSAFTGPADSVAVLEAGGTALSKWWAASGAATVAAAWISVTRFYDKADTPKGTVLFVAAIVSAAAILAIGYIVASDVRGRAAASVATINARRDIADAVISAALEARIPEEPMAAEQIVPLPAPLTMRYVPARGDEGEQGWKAIAIRVGDRSETEYLIVKVGSHKWAKADDVELVG
jgi:hypothetical protein